VIRRMLHVSRYLDPPRLLHRPRFLRLGTVLIPRRMRDAPGSEQYLPFERGLAVRG
jgi:hypothetical protein